jgi:hypothetical protein
MGKGPSVANVFLSVAGQNDNLGDSVLRRGFLDSFRAPSVEQMHVLVGGNDGGYLSAVGLTGTEVLHRTRASWERSLDRSILRNRTHQGFNAGEVQITSAKAHLGWRTLSRLTVARLRSGSGIHVGVGIRAPGSGSTRAVRAALRACTTVSWRDEKSRATIGVGSVHPDWAFGEPARGVMAPRERVVVTLRDDREFPSPDWIGLVSRYADSVECGITVFSQVVRDNERATELAARFGSGTEALTWNGGTHADWEVVARDLYARAHSVVSDRLHALVIGLTEGAVPIGMTMGSAEKLQRTLAPAGLGEFAFALSEVEGDPSARLSALGARSSDVAAAAVTARREVDRLSDRIRTSLS